MNDVRARLKVIYQLNSDVGIFLTPSGSDAEYISLLFAQVLNPGKHVTNIVTCNEEIGSGSLPAAAGKFFSPTEPIPGYHKHIDGGPKMNDPVQGLADNVEAIPVNARATSGDVIDAKSKIEEILKKC